MLRVRGLTISFGDEPLLNDVSFHLEAGERVGLVGPNGAGKTTLLRVLAGELPVPASALQWAGGRPLTAVLRQEDVSGGAPRGGDPPGGGDDPRGAPRSSGERMRRRLSLLLAGRPALLLLDEPTNHLDEGAQDWVARRLASYDGTVLVASHDRALLDAVCTRILAIDRGRLRAYPGNYSAYRERLAAEREEQAERYDDWDRERRRLRESARRQADWAARAHRQAGERNPYLKKRAAKAMKKATATETRLRRHEAARVEKPWREAPLDLSFLPSRRLPPVLVTMEDVEFRYRDGRPALRVPRLDVARGERVALVGPNGSGKSTLIRLIAACAEGRRPAEPLDAATRRAAAPRGPAPRDGSPVPEGAFWTGRVRVVPSARVLHFRQEGAVDSDRSALDQALSAGAPDAATARTLLAAFGLPGEAALRPAGTLSPGERMRLALCLAIVSGPDLLLLDEPTNHLDLPGRESLERGLLAFRGTVVFASHDRAFRAAVATREARLSEGSLVG